MLSRAISPLSYQNWQRQNRDESTVLQAQFTAWFEAIAETELLFKQHVYENPNMQEYDLRQHRMMLYALLHDGEKLAFEYIGLADRTGKEEEFKAIIALIDQKVKEIFGILMKWHGPLSAQQDIPESFKESVADMQAGNIVDADF